jgi:hypothetical protein
VRSPSVYVTVNVTCIVPTSTGTLIQFRHGCQIRGGHVRPTGV